MAVLLLLLAAAVDLTRGDSLLRDAWHRIHPPRSTPAEKLIQEIRP